MPQENNPIPKTVNKAEPSSPWLSRKDAAKYACVSVDTIDDWIKKGWIKRSKLHPARNGRVIIDRKSIDMFYRQCQVGIIA